MRTRWIGVLMMGMMAVLPVALSARGQTEKRDEALGRSVATDLAARKFDAVVAHYGEPLKDMMSAATLGKMWDTVTKNFGEFQSIESVKGGQGPDRDVVWVACKLQKAVVTVALKIDKKQMITDLRISYPMAPAK